MSKAPEHFRPFKIEHAKAGAPVSTIDGRAVTFLKWDLKGGTCNILGLVDNGKYGDLAVRWDDDGMPNAEREKECQLVMLPLGMCEGKPVFVGDELVSKSDGETYKALSTWAEMDGSIWKWPRPEPEYPQTKMTGEEISQVYLSGPGDPHVCFVHVVNTAIARACKDGDIVPAEMLEKVAHEAWVQCCAKVRIEILADGSCNVGAPTVPDDFSAIIKRVKEGK